MYGSTGSLDERSFVGAEEAVGHGLVKRFLQRSEAEALGRLSQHHALPRHRGNHYRSIGGTLHLLHGIDRRHACDGSTVFLDRLDHPDDGVLIDERPNSVVHQHNVVVRGVETSQGVGHGILPVLATFHNLNRRPEPFLFNLLLKPRALAFT